MFWGKQCGGGEDQKWLQTHIKDQKQPGVSSFICLEVVYMRFCVCIIFFVLQPYSVPYPQHHPPPSSSIIPFCCCCYSGCCCCCCCCCSLVLILVQFAVAFCAVQRGLDANKTMTLMFVKVEYVLGMTWSCLLELDFFFSWFSFSKSDKIGWFLPVGITLIQDDFYGPEYCRV